MDHETWEGWDRICKRHQLDVARITNWEVRHGESRCRADLTKTNRDGKCKQWIREFVWLGGKHLVVLDIIETPRPEIRRQWQLHSPGRPEIGDHVLVINGQSPDVNWADPTLKPKSQGSRLFCQTLIPHSYRLTLHTDGKAAAFDSTGKPIGTVEGNSYHRKYGQNVVQVAPESDGRVDASDCSYIAEQPAQMDPSTPRHRTTRRFDHSRKHIRRMSTATVRTCT